MNPTKLKDYTLTGSIHTVAVRSQGLVEGVPINVENCITTSTKLKGTQELTTTIINPNKLKGDLYKYSELYTAMGTILQAAGIDDYSLIRADLRLDSFDPEHYKQYAKLNKYLISALAITYSVTNCYRSTDLFSQEQLSVAIKNRYFEAENYDKNAESGGTDVAQSRLELRSKYFESENLPKEFTERWFLRLDRALTNLDKVQERYNAELLRIYNADRDANPCRFRSVTDFIIQYQDCIFTKAQLVELLSNIPEVGPEKAKIKAENHKKRYGIEYFSQKDMRAAVSEIKRATCEFFNS